MAAHSSPELRNDEKSVILQILKFIDLRTDKQGKDEIKQNKRAYKRTFFVCKFQREFLTQQQSDAIFL